ncbi:MAG: hypothetical protein ACKVQA_06005, partial [Burkholderiales bacterium]
MNPRFSANVVLRCLAVYFISIGTDALKNVRLILDGSTFELAYFLTTAVIPIISGLVIFTLASRLSSIAFKVGTPAEPSESSVSLATRGLQLVGCLLLTDCVPDLFSV